MSNYNFTKEMREISGFGGGYEQTCRDMLKAGLEALSYSNGEGVGAQ